MTAVTNTTKTLLTDLRKVLSNPAMNTMSVTDQHQLASILKRLERRVVTVDAIAKAVKQ